MKDEGWTLSDLAGELQARGIDIDDVQDYEIERNLWERQPEQAARNIETERNQYGKENRG